VRLRSSSAVRFTRNAMSWITCRTNTKPASKRNIRNRRGRWRWLDRARGHRHPAARRPTRTRYGAQAGRARRRATCCATGLMLAEEPVRLPTRLRSEASRVCLFCGNGRRCEDSQHREMYGEVAAFAASQRGVILRDEKRPGTNHRPGREQFVYPTERAWCAIDKITPWNLKNWLMR
jgi:hypothetical protein